jgi:hypothetical protein
MIKLVSSINSCVVFLEENLVRVVAPLIYHDSG